MYAQRGLFQPKRPSSPPMSITRVPPTDLLPRNVSTCYRLALVLEGLRSVELAGLGRSGPPRFCGLPWSCAVSNIVLLGEGDEEVADSTDRSMEPSMLPALPHPPTFAPF